MGIFTSFLTLIGCKNDTKNGNQSDTSGDSNIEYMNPNDILMTIPTIENTLPSTTEEEIADFNLEIMEDDWRQIELISKEFLPQIDQELESINSIFENDTSDMGEGMIAFRNLHVRNLIPSPIKSSITKSAFLESFSNSLEGTLSFMQYGRVKDGLYIETNSFRFYGTETNGKLDCIGFYGMNNFDQIETFKKELKAFMSKNNLVLVDWFPRLVVEADGLDGYFTPPPIE